MIDISPVTERDHDDEENVVFNGVDHPVVAHPDPEGITSFQSLRVRRTGVIGKEGDSSLDSSSDLRIEFS